MVNVGSINTNQNRHTLSKKVSCMNSPVGIILGAGQPFSGSDPSAIQKTSGNRRALDWTLGSLNEALEAPEIHFVGGYRLDDVVSEYSQVHFSLNENWEDTDTVGSLLTAPLPDDSEVYVCYADTIFESDAVERLHHNGADVTIAIDTTWRNRYQGRDTASLERAEKVKLTDNGSLDAIGQDLPTRISDAEFTGLMRLSPKAVAEFRSLLEEDTITESDDLPVLLEHLNKRVSVDVVDIGGRWAELETPDDISRFVLDTKANTLRRLSAIVERSTILEQYTFRVAEWLEDPTRICEGIGESFGDRSVIVRSSALSEDTWESSNAGRFESVLDVPADDSETLRSAIQRVVDSYAGENPDDQVLVQPMVADVDQSGVVMTRSLDAHSPYYVVNYDPATSSTESVTDGTGDQLRTAFIRKDAVNGGFDSSRTQAPSELAAEPLLSAIQEVEGAIDHDSLDVEFAIDGDGEVYLLQVRPITIDPGETAVDDADLYRAIDNAKRDFENEQVPTPSVVGDRTIYGVMPDWNPAEIIGRQPGLLAESLYRYLIMDETWARQRAEFGYRDVRPQPLMKCFAGQPYVDVRAVFNSFIPDGVSDELAEDLVTYYLDRLEANPELHDKVEFDIVITCLPFDFEHRAQPLRDVGFSDADLEELRDALREITVGAFERVESGYDLNQIEHLEDRYESLQDTDVSALRAVRYSLEDCRRLGTLPFAHLARAGFVAMSLLRSLERIDVLSETDVSRFLNSMNTVAREFERDGHRVSNGDLAWEEYVETYGHLRPGTYDITSPAYAQDPEGYLRPMVETATEPEDHSDPKAVWDDETKAAIEAELDGLGLPPDADRFIEFLRDSIEGREYSKFVFSKNLSFALEELARYGENHDLSREDLAHVPIDDVFELSANHPPELPGEWLRKRSKEGRNRHLVTEAVELPPLLFDPADFDCFERPSREPNFVTTETVRERLVEAEEETEPALDGAIVMIPQADPGYDWLFGYDIAGLITMYGGANSHMAIRAAEFGIPAAIGVGENKYQQLQGAEMIVLDCAGRTIERLK